MFDADFDSYASLPSSSACSSSMAYASATNELPLSAISLASFPETPTDPHAQKPNFHEYYSSCCALSSTGMSPLATNERPLSCTCLPKLLTDAYEGYSNCSATDLNALDNEPLVDGASNVQLSSSDPFPRGNRLEQFDAQSYSRNFVERLNELQNFCDRKSIKPKIALNNSVVRESERTVDLRSQAIHNESNRRAASLTHTLSPLPPIPPQSSASHSCQITVTPADSIACSTDHIHITDGHAIDTNTQTTRIVNANNNAVASTINQIKLCTSLSTSSATTTTTNVNNPTIPHPNIVKTHNSDATQTTTTSTTRRQRHSIAGQMGFFKIMDIAGGFSRKMTTSTTSLFSTAVISGSSSAPNLRDMIPNTASPSGRWSSQDLLLFASLCTIY